MTLFREQTTTYLASLEADTTRQSYGYALTDFYQWLLQMYEEEPDARLLTSEEVSAWRNHLSKVQKFKAATVNQKLAAVRGLARFHGNVISVRGIRKVEQPVETLNGREIGRMLRVVDGEDWLGKRNVALISLMVRAGLRVGEVVALQKADLTLSQRKGQVFIRRGKGVKERYVPLSQKARQALRAYLQARKQLNSPTLFLSRTNQPLSPRDVQRMVQQAAIQAGIQKQVTPHVLRHTFATRALYEGQVDLYTLSKILGHDSIATTARYLHPDRETTAKMLEDL